MSNNNFKGIKIELANFQGANLSNTNFQGASLGLANLEGVNLQGANLEGANIQQVFISDKFNQWKGAKYNKNTKFPEELNPIEKRMILIPLEQK